jgi:hypothetical protein
VGRIVGRIVGGYCGREGIDGKDEPGMRWTGNEKFG